MVYCCMLLVLAPVLAHSLPWGWRADDPALVLGEQHGVLLEGETVNMLDAIMQLMEGGGEFDRNVDEIVLSFNNIYFTGLFLQNLILV